MKSKDYMKLKCLFTIDGCSHCRFWKEFIERLNLKLSLDKQIEVIDCTSYHEYGIITHPLILKMNKFVQGSYPTLFYRGYTLSGGDSRIELEEFIKVMVHNDLINPEENPFMYSKNCQKIKKGVFKQRLICN